MKRIKNILVVFVSFCTLLSCTSNTTKQQVKLEVLATCDNQLTGVAVSKEGRVFVNFPKWSDDVPICVAEIINGEPVAYPNQQLQSGDGENVFVAVQSVVIDDTNRLWILDTRNPKFQGVMDGGPSLIEFNLENNSQKNVYSFPEGVYKSNSYFNDVRIDTKRQIAYITDSGAGAIIVLDLYTGKSRRLLDQHYSTQSEVDFLMCDGLKWQNTVHSDGIALSNDKKYLYYIALTGHTLYRVPTEALLSKQLNGEELGNAVDKVATIPATDGMMFDKKGNLWLGGLEDNSINLLRKDGSLKKVIKDEQIRWADSFAINAEGNIYFTTSQIHLPEHKREKYQVIRIVR